MNEAMTLHIEQTRRPTWSIPEAALLGLGEIFLLLLFSRISSHLVHRYGLARWLSRFQLRELTTLLSLVAIVMILTPTVLLIVRRRRLGSFWKSIEWSANKHFFGSLSIGAALAIAWSFSLIKLYGTAGYLRGDALSVILFILCDAIVSPAIEEIYFRGILFAALAKRLGPLASIAVVTVLFDLVHLGHWIDVLPVAVLLGATRLYTKSVSSCLVLHISYNLCVFCFLLVVKR